MGSLYSINSIKIYNRQDCCQFRWVGAIVSILDENEIDVVIQRTIENDNDFVEFSFTNPKNNNGDAVTAGRYIRITLDTGEILNFNELQVFGEPMSIPTTIPSTSSPSVSPSTSPTIRTTTTMPSSSQLQNTTTNIALNKTAKQSSTLGDDWVASKWVASNAVDGKINTVFILLTEMKTNGGLL